jgi:pimeloyl-ACP methyl ester carboxylesterase
MSAVETLDVTAGFERLHLNVNGTATTVLALGNPANPPLVFFHGAGTFHGWEFARPWATSFRVLIPFHPGFGESDDFTGLRSIDDLVLHYAKLFDLLGLHSDVNLVGFSLGGRLAARFAIAHHHRLRRLVLVAPAGLHVPEAPAPDLFLIPGDQLPGLLAHRFDTIEKYLPTSSHDVDFATDRYREMRTVAMLTWDDPIDRVIPRWLGTVPVPTTVLWGQHDALIPPGQAPAWAALVPGATVQIFGEAGHLVLDESTAAVSAVADFCA